jgi:hypothetical protein
MRRLSRPAYVGALQALYQTMFGRNRAALSREFFDVYLVPPWARLRQRQAALAGQKSSDRALETAPPSEGARLPARPKPPALLLDPAALPTVEQVLQRHPFLTRAGDGYLGIKPGDWHVAGNLWLPAGIGLRADRGFTLRFDRGTALIASGPLVLHGPSSTDSETGETSHSASLGEAPIRLLPAQDHWSGVYVLRADPATPSSLRNVEIRNARGVAGGAGLTFYQSPVILEQSQVLGSTAPTAIEIVGTSFHILQSELGAASGDLVRLEHAHGSLERCAFHDAPGDAIHVRGGETTVIDASVQRVQGSALHAGRPGSAAGSVVKAEGLRADQVGVGVTSAGAEAHVRDARIGRAAVAGLLVYEGGSLHASDVIFEDDSVPILVQEGSEATLNGTAVGATALDVGTLRPTPEPVPPMTPLQVRLGPSIWLVGYELTTPELAPGETVEVILYWRTFAPLDRQYTIFMHVRDADGETVAGWDMMPRYNTFPTTDWPVIERIDDAHIVPLPADLPPGEYKLALGLYYWGTGERLPAYTWDGEPIPEAAIVLEDTVTVK